MSSAIAPRVTFDFEEHVQRNVLPELADSHNANFIQTSTVLGLTHTRVDKKHRSQVCTHWLHGLCQKGSDCGYLHKLDKSKMPDCRHGQNCKIKNCPLKHTDDNAKQECMFFRQGFCFHGPMCRYRHIKLAPDLCPLVAKFEAFDSTGGAGGDAAPLSKKRKTNAPNAFYKITLCKHWLKNGVCPFGDECHYSHGEEDLKAFSGTDDLDDSDVFDPVKSKMSNDATAPWAEDAKVSYFLVHSPDLRSLVVSRRRGVWMLPVSVAAEVNVALQQSELVVLVFVVKALGGCYGVAKVTAPIPPPPPGYPISSEFPVTWLRTTRVSLKMVSQLKMPDGGSVARTTYDGLLVPTVGYEIMLVLLRKADWDWSTNLAEAESKKFDQERYMSAPLGPDVLIGQQWIDRAANMMLNIDQHRAPNAGMGGGIGKSPEEFFYNGSNDGFILGAPTQQLDEVFGRGLFTVPEHMGEAAKKVIVAGAPLFLMDTTTQQVFGLFEAIENVGMFEPTAFGGRSTMQVPFRVVLEAPPLPGFDREVVDALANNQHASMGPISVMEVKKLSTVFAIKAGVMKPRGAGGLADQRDRVYASGYKAPFDNVRAIFVGVDVQKHFQYMHNVRRALLGPRASNVLKVLEECAPPDSARARLRGLGSGYEEGPQKQELQEPMQFTICTRDPAHIQAVADGMERLVAGVRQQFP